MYADLAILAVFAFLYSIASCGLASIVFAVIVMNENLPGGDTITLTAVYTILLSVIGHGISAHPFVAALMAGKRRSISDD